MESPLIGWLCGSGPRVGRKFVLAATGLALWAMLTCGTLAAFPTNDQISGLIDAPCDTLTQRYEIRANMRQAIARTGDPISEGSHSGTCFPAAFIYTAVSILSWGPGFDSCEVSVQLRRLT